MKKIIGLLALTLQFASCSKISKDNFGMENTLLSRYKKLTLKEIQKNAIKQKENSSNVLDQGFPTLEESDMHNTFIYARIENGDDTSTIFITRVFRNEEFVCGIIGFFTEDDRILNAVFTYNPIEENVSKTNVYYIDGTLLGSYVYDDGHIIDAIVEDPLENQDQPSEQARSWWACTRECVNDATYACSNDVECMTLLLSTNFFSSGTPLNGHGSLSIGIACAYHCTRNRNFDLLPYH